MTDESLPLKSLLTHAGAFSLYLLAYVAQLVSVILSTIWPLKDSVTKAEYAMADFKLAVGFISEVLLFVIFTQLAGKEQSRKEETQIENVVVEDFDEEAEL